MPSIGNYIYGVSDDTVWINLYIDNTAEFKVGKKSGKLHQETNYPGDGKILLTVESISAPLREAIRLRLPGWCKSYSIAVNDEVISSPVVEKVMPF
jgi:DUF1680 family protein